MKTAISIPDTLFAAVERLAGQLGISRSELFAKAVKDYLAQNNQVGVTEKLDSIYGRAGDAQGLDPGLQQMQIRSIGEETW